MSRRLVLWRHGRTEWNATGLVQGSTDVALDEVGVQQAREAAARLASLGPVRIVSSDLQRATGTAAELAAHTGLSVDTDPRLREMAFGIREGRTDAEVAAEFPDEVAAWRADPSRRLPGAETYEEAGARVSAALHDVDDGLGAGETAVVVSHGAALRVGICRFLGFPIPLWWRFSGFSNCCWAVLEEGRDGWRVSEWNAGSLPEPILSDDPQDD